MPEDETDAMLRSGRVTGPSPTYAAGWVLVAVAVVLQSVIAATLLDSTLSQLVAIAIGVGVALLIVVRLVRSGICVEPDGTVVARSVASLPTRLNDVTAVCVMPSRYVLADVTTIGLTMGEDSMRCVRVVALLYARQDQFAYGGATWPLPVHVTKVADRIAAALAVPRSTARP